MNLYIYIYIYTYIYIGIYICIYVISRICIRVRDFPHSKKEWLGGSCEYIVPLTIRKAAQVLFRGTSILEYTFVPETTIRSPTFELVQKIALLLPGSDRAHALFL
jgi:hypothetical protein